MKREIKVFKSFEEQEAYKREEMRNTTILQRFQILHAMQQMTKKLHPSYNEKRRIIIASNGHIK